MIIGHEDSKRVHKTFLDQLVRPAETLDCASNSCEYRYFCSRDPSLANENVVSAALIKPLTQKQHPKGRFKRSDRSRGRPGPGFARCEHRSEQSGVEANPSRL